MEGEGYGPCLLNRGWISGFVGPEGDERENHAVLGIGDENRGLGQLFIVRPGLAAIMKKGVLGMESKDREIGLVIEANEQRCIVADQFGSQADGVKDGEDP